MKKKSYREMLRDRVPTTADLALRWCKVKGKWIDHVYTRFIHVAADKDVRYELTRTMLGISKKHRGFDFDYTIDWEGIDADETKIWKKASNLQKWFSKNLLFIEDDYKHYIRKNIVEEFPLDFIMKYLEQWLPTATDHEAEQKLQKLDNFTAFVTNYLEKTYKDYV